jgi:PhnB protein
MTGIQPELWIDRAAAAVAFYQAARAGATPASEMADEHGWRLGRILDPFGYEWEIGKPLGRWPPA